ncbi:MAG: PEP-CTERM sorting domain-containing protein [Verrucomicrobiota bacterium]
MKKSLLKVIIVSVALISSENVGFSQGSFFNLNFESPVLPLMRDEEFMVPITNGLPGWIGYIDGNQVPRVGFNTIALDSSFISLHSSASPIFQPLQGSYSVYLQGGRFSSVSAAIGQTGLVPQTAQSLLFSTVSSGSLQVTFSGLIIPMVLVSNGPNFSVMGGDISAFAGQTGELRFTAFNGVGSGLIDAIRFSTSPVPEPSTLALTGIGALLFGVFGWKNYRPKRNDH